MKHRFFIILFLLLVSATGAWAQSSAGSLVDVANTEEEASPYIPNAFTPNGDGVNDEFYITNGEYSRFTFAVFDRWGNQMYTTQDPEFRWNGEFKGNPAPTGTYVFVVEAMTTKGVTVKRSGTISLMR